jgi:hypothetical protein
MNYPPTLMHLRIKNEKTNFGLWLPLFLLFPLALAVLIILSPIIVIGLIVTWPGGWGQWALRVLWRSIVTTFYLRGLKVDILGNNQAVYISIV